MTDPEALIAAHRLADADTMNENHEWCVYVMNVIANKEKSLAEAGKELAALVDYMLIGKNAKPFNAEVSICVNEFWMRCIKEWEYDQAVAWIEQWLGED